MAATWVSKIGCGILPAMFQTISMSWRAAWKTLTTASLAKSSKNGVRSMPGASASITTASSAVAICATQSRG